jgi:hypothetical protein
MVRDIPWRIGHDSEKFRLIALNDEKKQLYVGLVRCCLGEREGGVY